MLTLMGVILGLKILYMYLQNTFEKVISMDDNKDKLCYVRRRDKI